MRIPLLTTAILASTMLACSGTDGTAPTPGASVDAQFRMHGPAAAAARQHFSAQLSGREEVPPVPTRARGQAALRLSDDATELHFRINVAGLVDIEQSHIHLAPAGENGPVVAWLRPAGPPPVLIPGRTDGPYAEGVIRAENLVGPFEGEPLSTLLDAMAAGDTYINIHTVDFPLGEIRGQIRQQGNPNR